MVVGVEGGGEERQQYREEGEALRCLHTIPALTTGTP